MDAGKLKRVNIVTSVWSAKKIWSYIYTYWLRQQRFSCQYIGISTMFGTAICVSLECQRI